MKHSYDKLNQVCSIRKLMEALGGGEGYLNDEMYIKILPSEAQGFPPPQANSDALRSHTILLHI